MEKCYKLSMGGITILNLASSHWLSNHMRQCMLKKQSGSRVKNQVVCCILIQKFARTILLDWICTTQRRSSVCFVHAPYMHQSLITFKTLRTCVKGFRLTNAKEVHVLTMYGKVLRHSSKATETLRLIIVMLGFQVQFEDFQLTV